MLALCHLLLAGQALTNALPADSQSTANAAVSPADNPSAQLPDAPSQEMLPVAEPEPVPASGLPVQLSADRQTPGFGRVARGYGDQALRQLILPLLHFVEAAAKFP